MNWTEAKHRIHERLISSEQSNKYNLLVKVGVAADVYRTWYIEKSGQMIAVTYPMLQQWTGQDDISIPDLEAAAAHNDGESYFVRKMSEILGFADDSTSQMYVVSKADGMFGATAVLDDTVQSRLQDIFPEGFYILPSSVHEVLAVSADTASPDDLAFMVKSINRDQVSEEDRLSDHVFTVERGRLTIAA